MDFVDKRDLFDLLNFLDLLLPSFEQKPISKKEEEKTFIPKLEFTEEEKSYDLVYGITYLSMLNLLTYLISYKILKKGWMLKP